MSESGSVNSAGTKSDQAALDEQKKQLSRLRVLIYQKGQSRMTAGASATDASKQAWLHAMKNSKTGKPASDDQKVANVIKLEKRYSFLDISDELEANWEAIMQVLHVRIPAIIS